jgi:signal peptidase II
VSARRYSAFALAASLSLAFDQLSKVWARHVLRPIYPEVKTVIARYWEFRYSENPAAAFGLFRGVPGARWLFAVVAVAIAVGSIVYLRRDHLRRPLRIAVELGLVVGGALGNAVDRIVFGHVTDFVVWKIGTHEWDTFNVADAALVVGILGLLVDAGKPKRKPAPAS